MNLGRKKLCSTGPWRLCSFHFRSTCWRLSSLLTRRWERNQNKTAFSAEKFEESTETEADDGSSWPTKKVESRQFFEIFSSNSLHCPSLVRMCESFVLVTHHFVNLSFSQLTNTVFYKGKGVELDNKMGTNFVIWRDISSILRGPGYLAIHWNTTKSFSNWGPRILMSQSLQNYRVKCLILN